MAVDSQHAIAVIGNVNIDIRTSPIDPNVSLFLDGETSAADIYETVGGGAANVSVAARRLGGDVWFCAALGDDSAGDRLERGLSDLGIHTCFARKKVPTGRSINLNWTNHNRHFISYLPSAAELQRDDVDIDRLVAAGCRQLYRGDVWFADRMLKDGNTAIMEAARESGMTTHVDINWDPMWGLDPNSDLRRSLLRETLRYVDYVHGNERELIHFTGQADVKCSVVELLKAGVGTVILHRGPGGSAAITSKGQWYEVPSRPVARPLVETGTGDVFSAAFLQLDHLPLGERLERANTAAADYLHGRLHVFDRL